METLAAAIALMALNSIAMTTLDRSILEQRKFVVMELMTTATL
jgi:hypothetical protein